MGNIDAQQLAMTACEKSKQFLKPGITEKEPSKDVVLKETDI